ncbi:hypothetical protein ZPAH1_orf00361 [Aeromonas phage ZPAH1]|nr:hypothetical protein ASwh1_315 [Aeromonas phage Aswh_1]QQG34123.1 hypothetical protein ZPAH1_orf00361 [Aeromonas phage ZPAH1]
MLYISSYYRNDLEKSVISVSAGRGTGSVDKDIAEIRKELDSVVPPKARKVKGVDSLTITLFPDVDTTHTHQQYQKSYLFQEI